MIAEATVPAIPIVLITGFLGSGKTTLLNALLRAPDMRDTAVLVNEFGDIGIDHLLVETLDDDVVLLNAGCLCCTIRGDIVASLASLFERRARGEIPAFRRVMIETTGLADPAPILHTLLGHEAIRDRYRVEAIVSTVDAVNGDRHLTEHDESVKQVAVADSLVITKTDIADRGAVDALRRRLDGINAGAPILEVVGGAVAPSWLMHGAAPQGASLGVARWLNGADDRQRHDVEGNHAHSRHDDGIRQSSIETDDVIEAHRLIGWIERLLETHGDKVLRVKGVLNMAGSDTPVVVHGVQHVFHPLAHLSRWPDGDRRSRIVIIARDLPMGPLEESFRRSVLSPR
jgi:G3E family GTPase